MSFLTDYQKEYFKNLSKVRVRTPKELLDAVSTAEIKGVEQQRLAIMFKFNKIMRRITLNFNKNALCLKDVLVSDFKNNQFIENILVKIFELIERLNQRKPPEELLKIYNLITLLEFEVDQYITPAIDHARMGGKKRAANKELDYYDRVGNLRDYVDNFSREYLLELLRNKKNALNVLITEDYNFCQAHGIKAYSDFTKLANSVAGKCGEINLSRTYAGRRFELPIAEALYKAIEKFKIDTGNSDWVIKIIQKNEFKDI